ncbi:MAG: hypothetical protein A2Y29_15440 [Spirochaetes bacterium GWE2_31_10]|nr:MAG: hypothetical protein A2Y29_15440 [Spirochaetes bacterium GWE2_31_10]
MYNENIKRNRMLERIVGYFFSKIIVISIGLVIFLSFKGEISFFKSKYVAYYQSGSGLIKGTVVTLNGIIIGEVTKVAIDDRNRIEVTMSISNKYHDKIKRDSVAKIVRSMLIGSKQISISPGSDTSAMLPPGSVLRAEDSSELVDLISGVSIDKFVKALDIKKTFLDFTGDDMVTAKELYEQGVSALVLMNEFQKSLKDMSFTMYNLSKSLNEMGGDLKSMGVLSQSIEVMSSSLKDLSLLSKSMTDISKSITGVNKGFDGVTNAMNSITGEARDLKPAIEKIDLLMDDLSILLLAMQKSWMFKTEVDLVKKEKEDIKNGVK